MTAPSVPRCGRIPRCDGCQQPLIGTALCRICAAELEAYRAEQNADFWEGS